MHTKYRQPNKIIAKLTFSQVTGFGFVFTIQMSLWLLQTKTSYLWKVRYPIILFGWQYIYFHELSIILHAISWATEAPIVISIIIKQRLGFRWLLTCFWEICSCVKNGKGLTWSALPRFLCGRSAENSFAGPLALSCWDYDQLTQRYTYFNHINSA